MGRGVVAILIVACAGCGLDESGLAPVDDGGPVVDVVVDVTQPKDGGPADGGAPDVIVTDAAPPPEAGSCEQDSGSCTAPEVPGGWNPVAYIENPTAPCAAPFSGSDDEFKVTVGTAACACGCTKTADPDCASGTIATFYSIGQDNQCDDNGLALTFNKGACVTFGANTHIDDYYKSAELTPKGGTCTAQTNLTGSLATTPVRLCTPDSSCTTAACGGYAPPGYTACIEMGGDQPCPNGSSFSNKISVGKTATPTCADCGGGCQLTNLSCMSPQVHFFKDNGCTMPLVALPSDGTTCAATNNGGAAVGGVTYTATPSSVCQATGTTGLQIGITGQKTVCCR